MRMMTTMICAAAMSLCGTLLAQSSPDLITVHFATPVMVGDVMLPAGDCSIQVLHGASDNIILAVRSASGGVASVMVNRLTDSNIETNGHVNVVLNRRSKGYQLDQILLPNHNGYQVLD